MYVSPCSRYRDAIASILAFSPESSVRIPSLYMPGRFLSLEFDDRGYYILRASWGNRRCRQYVALAREICPERISYSEYLLWKKLGVLDVSA